MKPLDIDDLARRYQSGEALEAIAKSVGLTGNGLRHRLKLAGIRLDARKGRPGAYLRKRAVDDAALVARYRSGHSELDLSVEFGISRPAVRRRLLDAGVAIRGRSDAASNRFRKMSPEERSRLAEPSHAAIRGVPKREETLHKIALRRQRVHANVGPSERALLGWLRGMAIEAVPQKAVGRYNLDIALAESRIAVEIFGGNWHTARRHQARFRPRIDYLADRGWHTVIVWVTADHPLAYAVAENIRALHEAVREGEPLGRQEHVMRGDGYVATVGQVKPHNGAIVLGFNPGNPRRGDDGRFR